MGLEGYQIDSLKELFKGKKAVFFNQGFKFLP